MSVRFAAKLFAGVCLLSFLPSCSTVPVGAGIQYSKSLRQSLYKLQEWSFEGRLAITGAGDSWTANIVWLHRPGHEEIKLSGPLGQGAALVTLDDDSVTIDRGNGDVQSSEDVEGFVGQKLGLVVPVKLLRFWVVGVPQPDLAFNETDNGFTQLNWLNEYKQIMAVGERLMPQRVYVTNGKIKLKLIVDQWHLDGGNGK